MQCNERTLREENARRKQSRIIQVREQSREIAAKLRKRINEEKERQKDHVEKVKIDELRKWRTTHDGEVQGHFDRIIGTSLDANEEARREVEAHCRYEQRKHELDLIAAHRGRSALRRLAANQRGQSKPPQSKPRCRSMEVQTESIRTGYVGSESTTCKPMAMTDDCLAPESVKCDHDHAPISARSVDILEKSKQFVEDANRRLNAISAKVSRCQQAKEHGQEIERIPTTTACPKRDVPPKGNTASRLRTDVSRKPAAPAPRAPPNRPKKVIPSTKDPIPTAPGRGSVVCYDHPNRFTKTYDIPKNVVVKKVLAEDEQEDDAVANALNETLSNSWERANLLDASS